ncbi:hypothetical protein Hanom_Chr12g01071471 [Helianthus anomalus]
MLYLGPPFCLFCKFRQLPIVALVVQDIVCVWCLENMQGAVCVAHWASSLRVHSPSLR